MSNKLFSNIGEKIKKLALATTIIGIIISLIYGIVMFVAHAWVTGVIVILAGGLASWVGSFVLYGFGEIIVYLKRISSKLDRTETDCNCNDEE